MSTGILKTLLCCCRFVYLGIRTWYQPGLIRFGRYVVMLCSEFNSLTQTQHRLGANKVYTGHLKKIAIWKCDTFCFINQLSNDFQQRNIIACKHLAHCSYFEYKTVSDNQVLTEIWLVRHFDQVWWLAFSWIRSCLFNLNFISEPRG